MVLLYYGAHKLYNLLFHKSEKMVDPQYFFTNKFGLELFIIGVITLAIGGILFWIGTWQLIIQYISYVFLILGGFMIYRGILKMLVFKK